LNVCIENPLFSKEIKMTLIEQNAYVQLSAFPAELHEFIDGATLFENSGESGAQTIFADKKCGYFIKSAAKGTLKREAAITQYFHGKGEKKTCILLRMVV
jgi:aminoglycoside phosphotransferase